MGIDVVSSDEIYSALSAGFPLEKAYFHSNNKTDADIEYAIENGIVVEFLPMLAFKLPARLTVIEEEAFKGIDAEKVIIPAGDTVKL